MAGSLRAVLSHSCSSSESLLAAIPSFLWFHFRASGMLGNHRRNRTETDQALRPNQATQANHLPNEDLFLQALLGSRPVMPIEASKDQQGVAEKHHAMVCSLGGRLAQGVHLRVSEAGTSRGNPRQAGSWNPGRAPHAGRNLVLVDIIEVVTVLATTSPKSTS